MASHGERTDGRFNAVNRMLIHPSTNSLAEPKSWLAPRPFEMAARLALRPVSCHADQEATVKKYDDIRNDIKTGDIVLFSGKMNVSRVIQLATMSKWSHVGVALWNNALGLLIWESARVSRVRDAIDGKIKSGTQVVSMRQRIEDYFSRGGEVAVRHVLYPDGGDGDAEEAERRVTLERLRKQFRNRPYGQDILELALAAYDGLFGENEEDLSSLFCSELVAEAYQAFGLLSPSKPSNEYTPADFGRLTDLRAGAQLDTAIAIEP